jgi:hypothetical protein
MSTETLVSCAETRQTGATKTSAAIKTRFIMRQIRVPLYSVTNKSGRSVTADRGWQRPFEDPIPLPRGRQLVTLRDAGNYITKLPKAEHETAEWQAAMEALILVADLGGPTMFARIGVMRALNRHVERVFDPSRNETKRGAPSWRAIGETHSGGRWFVW